MASLVTAAVVITDPWEAKALRVALDLLREQRLRNGMQWPSELQALHMALGELSPARNLLRNVDAADAMKPPSRDLAPIVAQDRVSPGQADGTLFLDAKSAAQRLGVSVQYLCRIAETLGGFQSKPRGPWAIPVEMIEAAVAAKRRSAA